MKNDFGCTDHNCYLAIKKRGMGTNGGCHCLDAITDRETKLKVIDVIFKLKNRIEILKKGVLK